MHEVFPVAAGAALGLLAYRVSSIRLRMLLIAVLSVLIGVTATFISGEALISWGFVAVDIPEVLLAAGLVLFAQSRVTRHSTQLR
jgi:hypothetical protein